VRSFERRHNSITAADLDEMLRVVGFKSVDALIDATVPSDIRREVR
jgi:glycine dehydrogenase